ncbi:Transcription factor GTE4 [Rhynchospora pubera]|uniref:Transcription factor GTE4 n=1 Tax=Rhynchospora pubera TaxID=906938 RepID=A0AAV8EUI7_9POAL|nr:Transcription factor GTE4 [Rhynchospora pubera]
MASGPGDGSVQHQRYNENKVYTRKSHGKNSKLAQAPPTSAPAPPDPTPHKPPPQQNQSQSQSHTQNLTQKTLDPAPAPAPAPVTDDVSSTHRDAPAEPDPEPEPVEPPPVSNPPNEPVLVSDDEASSLNRGSRPSGANGNSRSVTINLSSQSRQELRELRRKLSSELEQVRALSKRLDVAAATTAAIVAAPPLAVPEAGYTLSQFSATDPDTPVARQPSSKRGPDYMTNSALVVPVSAPTPPPVMTPTFPGPKSVPFRRQLSVSVSGTDNFPTESFEKEKRTPKANQLYRNSEFLLAKDRIPPPESNKKSKSGSKKHSLSGEADYNAAEKKLYSNTFKKCSGLLSKLMKHKFGWVFNKPVDPVALGLHDYLTIIKHPMDLGTIKTRLSKNWYKSPREFAEDVRLTFRNAMTYNPKGQDVHFMAEQLNQVFEEGWSPIEAEMSYHLSYHPPTPVPPKKAAVSAPPASVLERSDSTLHPPPGNYSQVQVPAPLPHMGRPPALKKPKAKDPHKRDMTFEEKRKLSNNLQNLPPEKLDVIVQIIKRKNLSLSQHDDEIEVDIDSMDAETLWELDRFVTNYKKNLSKNKRKAELAMLARRDPVQNALQTVQERVEEPAPGEAPNRADENYIATSGAPAQEENKGENPSRSTSTSSSSSDSGSSSSDSDSDSSSAYGSDGGAQ